MTAPRQVLAGQTYFITRRCSDRRFFLVPSPVVNGIFLFCLAFAAALTRVQIHAVCVMSNHIHLVVTDTAGLLPQFMAWLNRHSAICLKVLRRRGGPIWEAAEKYSAVALHTPTAVYQKLVYTVTNPPKAGLVRSHKEWPGLCLGAESWDRPIETERPLLFFKPSKQPPPFLQLSVPPALAEWNPQRLQRSLKDAVARREDQIAAQLAHERKHVLGARRVRQQEPYDRPACNNPTGTLNPAFSAIKPSAVRAVAVELKLWRQAYRQALEQVRDGMRDVVFPAGTWWMARYGGARVAPG